MQINPKIKDFSEVRIYSEKQLTSRSRNRHEQIYRNNYMYCKFHCRMKRKHNYLPTKLLDLSGATKKNKMQWDYQNFEKQLGLGV